MSGAKAGALILSGGKSRRMGQDKTTLEVNGESFLARAADFWSKVPGISAIYLGIGSEEHLQKVQSDKAAAAVIAEKRIIPVFDRYEKCGPMAGIHAAFLAGEEDLLYVCAIDIPNMDVSMLPMPDDSGADAWVYRYEDKAEPLFALYSRSAQKTIEEMLEEGNFKLQDLIRRIRTRYLPLEKEQLRYFYNCNTPEDLKRIRSKE